MKQLIQYKDVEIRQQELTILRDVNLEVNSGEFIYLLGKVGSGKSSLLKSFYAEVPVKTGDATILDYDLRKIKRNEVPFLRRKIGIVFQDFQLLMDRTVYETVEVEVERELSLMERIKLAAFWYLAGAVALCVCLLFRKPLWAALRKIF